MSTVEVVVGQCSSTGSGKARGDPVQGKFFERRVLRSEEWIKFGREFLTFAEH